MSDTIKLTPVIPEGLAHKPPITWSPVDVLAYLEANKEQYYLDNEDINPIRDNKVSGHIFLNLTRDLLLEKPFNLSYGGAATIDKLIKDLPRKSKPPPQQEPPQEPQQELYSYRTNSGILSHSSSQTHKNVDPYIIRELQDTTKIDVGGFDNIFGPHLEPFDLPNPSLHGLSAWSRLGQQEFESYGVQFFKEFSDHEFAKTSDRCYRGSGNKPLKDAHNATQRKPDIFLLAQEHLPKDDSTDYSWKYVLVVGEFKYTEELDKVPDTLIQLAGYVREIFGAQPGRLFVYAFTVCGRIARIWLFDRAGVSASQIIDISTEDGSRSFRCAMLGFMRMSKSDLGIGESESGLLTVQGKRFKLLEVLHRSSSIVSRGTVCWKAEIAVPEVPGVVKQHVVKECWRDKRVAPESELWERAKKKGVLGYLDILASEDREFTGMGFGADGNIRRRLDYKSAKNPPFKKWSTTSVADKRTSSAAVPTNSGTSVMTTSKKRAFNETDTTSSKRLKTTKLNAGVEARVRTLMVMRNYGQKLETITSPRALLEVIRDAIRCHQSLYEKGGILHCDISVNNIMMDTEETRGIKGFLIDLDNARCQIIPNEDTPTGTPLQTVHSLDPKIVTGTPPFMALELLHAAGQPITQTWRHDLESFLYVLIWVCTQSPFVTLRQWLHALTNPAAASAKQNDISNGFTGKILPQFKSQFEKVKPVVKSLREILFYERAVDRSEMYITTPPGDEARIKMYDKVIKAFDDGIRGDEVDEWVAVE